MVTKPVWVGLASPKAATPRNHTLGSGLLSPPVSVEMGLTLMETAYMFQRPHLILGLNFTANYLTLVITNGPLKKTIVLDVAWEEYFMCFSP